MIRFMIAAAIVALSTTAHAADAFERSSAAECDYLSCYGKQYVIANLAALGGTVTLDSYRECRELNDDQPARIPCVVSQDLITRPLMSLGKSDRMTVKGKRVLTECFSLTCYGKQLVGLGFQVGKLDSVTLGSRAECEYLNFATLYPLPCVSQ